MVCTASTCQLLETNFIISNIILSTIILKRPSSAGKGLSFINENQNEYCEYMFVVRNFNNINWEHVNSMTESPSFYSF